MALRLTTPVVFAALTILASAAAAQRSADDSLARPARAALAAARVPEGATILAPGLVDVIDSAEIASAHAETFSELLRARRAGLSVLKSGGSLSDGSRVQLRGPASILAPTYPLVLVDGIVMDGAQEAGGTDVTIATSRLDDLVPEDIARIEIFRGAAAASRFGAGAANGVISVTTKRGGRGPAAVRASAEAGIVAQSARYPDNVTRGGSVAACTLALEASGACTPGAVVRFNPLERYDPFRVGRLTTANASAAGALLGVVGFLGGTVRDDAGVTAADARRRRSVRATLGRSLPGGIDVEAGAHGVWRDAVLAPNGNVVSTDNPVLRALLGTTVDDANHGYYAVSGLLPAATTEAGSRRGASAALRWAPARWFHASGVYGTDRGSSHDITDVTSSFGRDITRFEASETVTSLAGDLGAAYGVRGALRGQTALGWRSLDERVARRQVFSLNDLENSRTITSTHRASTLWLRQSLGFGERGAIEGSITRVGGDGIAAGSAADVLYGIAGAFTPWRAGGGTLTLRARYGEAVGDESGTGIARVLGAPIVGPDRERTRETELGLTATLGTVVEVGVTAFDARSSDLLAPAPRCCSTAVDFVSAASMRTSGIEGLVRLASSPARPIRASATLTASGQRNRVRSLGAATRLTGPFSQSRPGYPLNAFWAIPYVYGDVNHDGIIASAELVLRDTAVFVASSVPTREAALHGELGFGRFRVATVLDYRGGFAVMDLNAALRCQFARNCAALFDPATSLARQADAVAIGRSNDAAAYREDGTFVRLRDLRLTWDAPPGVARGLAARTLSLSVVGRDLATWTSYPGLDPEASALPIALARADLGTLPTTRRVLIRLDLGR